LTPGFTGADLENHVNEATLIAARRNAEVVSDRDFNEAVERMLTGLEKRNRLINPFERTVVAHHEMGHAIVGSVLMTEEAVHKISIIPRGIGALGYTLQRPTEDRFLMTKEELEKKISVLLAGRAAELIIFGHLSTGAADDLEKATDIAWAAVTRYGMAESLRDIVYEKSSHSFLGEMAVQPRSRNYSETTAHQIDVEVRDMVGKAFAKATQILAMNEGLLRETAKLLIEKETLNEHELKEIFAVLERPPRRSPELSQ
jgi:cell division protease FtsH